MASVLKVDEMQGVTSAGDITITGEGGSATQSLQQGVAKGWTHGSGGTGAIDDSLNHSSSSDNGSGSFSQNFTNNMNNSTYSMTSMCGRDDNSATHDRYVVMHKAITTGTRVSIRNSSGSAAETTALTTTINGDLA